MIYDVIIIGSGPAGLTAAIYGKRAGMNLLVIEKQPMSGGQILNTYDVDNYPALPGIGGFELGMKFKEHADKAGAVIVSEDIREVQLKDKVKTIITNKNTYEAKTVILATGAGHRELGVPGEQELRGMGVSYCATCDGAFFRGKEVAVVGGGDVALEDALFLARSCSKVYLIHRRDTLRGAKILQQKVSETENIEILWNTVVEKINGNGMVESISIYNRKKEGRSELTLNGVFIAVGTAPETELFAEQVGRTENGYIIAEEDCITDCAGVFAAGDIRTKQLRQIITAAADGANAITSVEKYLYEN